MKKTDKITVELTAFQWIVLISELGTETGRSIENRMEDGDQARSITYEEMMKNYFPVYENILAQLKDNFLCDPTLFTGWEKEKISTQAQAKLWASRNVDEVVWLKTHNTIMFAEDVAFDWVLSDYMVLTDYGFSPVWTPLTEIEVPDA